MKLAYVDIESNGLLYSATMIHCICWMTDESEEVCTATTDKEFMHAIAELNQYTVVGHNFEGYDKPLLNKLGYGLTSPVIDTLLMAQLVYPDRPRGHSLESYASSTGLEKIQNECWDVLTDNMIHRCQEDVKITKRLFNSLHKKMDGWDWEEAMSLEHQISSLHAQQVLNGVKIDVDSARRLYRIITDEIKEISTNLIDRIGYKGELVDTPHKIYQPFKKDGNLSSNTIKYYGLNLVWGVSTRVSFDTINLNSFNQIKEYLLSIGWKPDEWTYKKDKMSGRLMYHKGEPVKSSPKITESSMDKLDSELGKQLAKLFILKHRQRVIYTEKKNGTTGGLISHLRDDGRVGADAHTLGTNTRRYRHHVVVNIPKANDDVLYGKELRGLFVTEPGYSFMGTDADSLEARIAGHFTAKYDGGEFARKLLEADVHQELADALGITRQHAKTVYYGISYGAQPKKIAETLGVPVKRGQEIFDGFWETNHALAKVRDEAVKQWKLTGYITAIDGGRLSIRSEHSVMNAMFQAAGSIIVKRATIIFHDKLKDAGVNWAVQQCIHYHDEFSCRVLDNKRTKDLVTKIVRDSWKEAGEYYSLNVETSGEAVFGDNWAEVH